MNTQHKINRAASAVRRTQRRLGEASAEIENARKLVNVTDEYKDQCVKQAIRKHRYIEDNLSLRQRRLEEMTEAS